MIVVRTRYLDTKGQQVCTQVSLLTAEKAVVDCSHVSYASKLKSLRKNSPETLNKRYKGKVKNMAEHPSEERKSELRGIDKK